MPSLCQALRVTENYYVPRHLLCLEAGHVSLSNMLIFWVRWSRGCQGRAKTITVCIHPHTADSYMKHGIPPPQHALAQRELCFWSLRSPKHLMSLYVPHFPLFIHIIIRKRSCFQLLENERRIPLWSNLPSHQLPLLGSCRERREGQRLNCLCFHLEENFCALLSQANGALAKLIFRLVNSGTAGLTILTVGGWKGQCRPWHKTKDKVRNS